VEVEMKNNEKHASAGYLKHLSIFSCDPQFNSWPKDLEVEGWTEDLYLRNKETREHTLCVTELTVMLAKMAAIPEEEIPYVRRGALLHDIGKMGIPDAILVKPGRLSSEEWNVMRRHPDYALDLLYPIEYLRPCISIPYSHHEKWDGSGYPRGLKGEEIPLPARLFAIVDVWDALSSDHTYRDAWSESQVIEYIQQHSGRHFDPEAVEIFLYALIKAMGRRNSDNSQLPLAG
jgi:putative nucleotidyltransferase with HDIG domain